MKGLLIIIASPSGGGKGSVIKHLLSDSIKFSVSATTRRPRPGEIDGVHYFFVSREQFEEMIATGEMLEYAEYMGNYYGTPKSPVKKWTDAGLDVLLDIEIKGAAQVKEKVPECVSVFILPPSMRILEKRLTERATEPPDIIKGRIEIAKVELEEARKFDYIVVNDKLEDAVEDVKAIIKAEKLRYKRNEKIVEEVLEDA